MSRTLFALAWLLGIRKVTRKIKRIISPPMTLTVFSGDVMELAVEPDDMELVAAARPDLMHRLPNFTA